MSMEMPEFEESTMPASDAPLDLAHAYTIAAVFHTISRSPAARIAEARGTNIFAALLLYVRENRPDLWQSIVEALR
jgi:hypothetical protein